MCEILKEHYQCVKCVARIVTPLAYEGCLPLTVGSGLPLALCLLELTCNELVNDQLMSTFRESGLKKASNSVHVLLSNVLAVSYLRTVPYISRNFQGERRRATAGFCHILRNVPVALNSAASLATL